MKTVTLKTLLKQIEDGKVEASYDVPMNGGYVEVFNLITRKRETIKVITK